MMKSLENSNFRSSDGGKRGRFEIRLIVIAALLIIVLGGAWVFFNGSPTSHRAALDSSENPRSTLAP
ncbi:hypothetical protein [Caulobacter sp. UNC279MFTsu5.1]|uniref:hypothetical protein n=1 Tax=Caulobacter sp. UNC279MFTsu5.1 TaxID=1502775 RepID=UPI0003734843|nr:hypothetical protein [Caulobacter sp. UNC279MFTsu5.1]SFJ46748.1 hypothetical protein SAMN02799626_01852 [Caulobacter sp. UNC279MFTsu5.1]